jgi:cytochrome c5
MMPAHSDNQDVAHTIRNAVAVFAGSIGLILIVFMLAQYAVGAYSARARQGDPAMSPAAIAERLKPLGEVKVDASAPPPIATTVVASNPAPGGSSNAGGRDQGKVTYEAVCSACHLGGLAGAPKTGDKAAWSARMAQGKDALYASALKGKGVMPAKGGNPALSDDNVKAAVDYLVSQIQ